MPELILKLGDATVQTYVFDKEVMNVGRGRDNDVIIENLSVSRNHLRIKRQGEKFILTDLNSANGTYVNGKRVQKVELLDEDVVTLGKHRLLFQNRTVSEENLIAEAFGADRTVLVSHAPATAVAVLYVRDGKQKGKEFQLTKEETSIGKASANDIILADDWFLAKKQAVIRREGDSYTIQDLGSFRKTRVNGSPIGGGHILQHNDEIEFSSTRCVFMLQSAADGPARVPREIAPDDSIFSDLAEDRPQFVVPSFEEVVGKAPPRHNSDSEDTDDVTDRAAELLAAERAARSSAEEEEPGLRLPVTPKDPVPAAEQVPAHLVDPSPSAPTALDFEAPALALPPDEEPLALAALLGDDYAQPPPPPDTDAPPSSEPVVRLVSDTPNVESESPTDPSAGQAQETPAPSAAEAAAPESNAAAAASEPDGSPDVEREIRLWEHALTNKSPLIRKQAAAMLKKLTGRDYEH